MGGTQGGESNEEVDSPATAVSETAAPTSAQASSPSDVAASKAQSPQGVQPDAQKPESTIPQQAASDTNGNILRSDAQSGVGQSISADTTTEPGAGRFSPPVRDTTASASAASGSDVPAQKAEAPAEAPAKPPARKWVPPHVRRQQEAAAAAAAAAAAGGDATAPGPELPTDFAKDMSGGTARFGFSVKQGLRSRMEDAVDGQQKFSSGSPSVEFYAVYDGHGGTDCADFVRKNLPQAVRDTVNLQDESGIEASMQKAFLAIDDQMFAQERGREGRQKPWESAPKSSDEAAADDVAMDLSSGTVVCMALISDNKQVHVVNLGDSRAAMCNDGKLLELTRDHAPKVNPEESERLQECGVEVSSDGYLHAGLAVSRALGGLDFRTGKKCKGLSAVPDITKATITDDSEFLVIASDGIWEVMETKEAMQIVRRRLRSSGSPQAAAEALVTSAAKMQSSDNISAVVVMFKQPPSL